MPLGSILTSAPSNGPMPVPSRYADSPMPIGVVEPRRAC